jgi:hypothetical protein
LCALAAAIWILRAMMAAGRTGKMNEQDLVRLDASELEFSTGAKRHHVAYSRLVGARLLGQHPSALYRLLYSPRAGLELWFLDASTGDPRKVTVDWHNFRRTSGHIDTEFEHDGNEDGLQILQTLWRFRIAAQRPVAVPKFPAQKFMSVPKHVVEFDETTMTVTHGAKIRKFPLNAILTADLDIQPIETSPRFLSRRMMLTLEPALNEAPVEIQLGRLPDQAQIIERCEIHAARFR